MNLSKITSSYLDRPYEEITCMDFVRSILNDMGFNFPTDEQIKKVGNEITMGNHLEHYHNNPVKLQALMLKMFCSFFNVVKSPLPGDVIMLKNRNDGNLNIWPCVYVGREIAYTSFADVGVKAIRYKLIGNPFIIFRTRNG